MPLWALSCGRGRINGFRATWVSILEGCPARFLRNLRGVSTEIPVHSELTHRIIEHSSSLALSELFPEREIRTGSDDFPVIELLKRMPDCYAHWL
jgi:hypothetical protein